MIFFPGVLAVRQIISACCIGAVRRQEEFLLDQGDMWSETWEKIIERKRTETGEIQRVLEPVNNKMAELWVH